MQRDQAKIKNRSRFVRKYVQLQEKNNPGINKQEILNELCDYFIFKNKRTLERIIYNK